MSNFDNKSEDIESQEGDIHPLFETFIHLQQKVKEQKATLTAISSNLRIMEKQIKKLLKKTLQNKEEKDKNKKRLTGLTKIINISEELRSFLNIENKDEVSRTVVTKFISQYVKDNNLQNANDKRIIKPNKDLINLLKLKEDDVNKLTFFNIQKYLKIHYYE